MKNKQDEFKKEKQQLNYIKSKQLVLFLIMTFVAFISLMTILLFLILAFKKTFN